MATATTKPAPSGGASLSVGAGSTAPSANEAPEQPPKKKKGKRKKLIIAIVLVLILGAAAKVMLGGAKPSASAAAQPGPLVALDAVTVNLKGGHYLRIGVTVQFTSTVSATTPPDGAMATDQIIVYFTGQDAAPLETSAGLQNAREELKSKIATAYPHDPVYDILFTSFVVQ